MSDALDLPPDAIALNRFGLGVRPGDSVEGDPRGWLLAQLEVYQARTAGFDALPDAGETLRTYRAKRRVAKADKAAAATQDSAMADADAMMAETMKGTAMRGEGRRRRANKPRTNRPIRALYEAGVQARLESALNTEAPFVERLVHFWANHFCVSADTSEVLTLAPSFERDAIRPHVLGNFEDMLMAAEHHPAMLLYLNQASSVGPESQAARRALRKSDKARGLNENLGREIMELHTMGVRSGYTQADVTEFSRALTGWTVDGYGASGGRDAGFAFRAARHEPGSRHIVDKTYAQQGEAQASAALRDFARSPATAAHIATKLARHFAGDDPPPALVSRLASSFTESGGDLPTVYRALVGAEEAWAPQARKFKTPWEWTVSVYRGAGRTRAARTDAKTLDQLGQPTWKPGAPAGWDDIAATWAAPDALYRRVEWIARFAATIGDQVDARTLAPVVLPGALSPATGEQISRAESPAGALAILFASPEFLRR